MFSGDRVGERAGVGVDDGGGDAGGGTRAATRFVAPTTARWRYWREGDDVRVKDGNEDWCVKVNRAGTTMGAAAVVKRFKKAREACVTVASARDECGDEVEMALTSRPNASEELPEEIAALVRENIVRGPRDFGRGRGARAAEATPRGARRGAQKPRAEASTFRGISGD